MSVVGVGSLFTTSAQTTPVNFDPIANNCQLVVEKNNLKNQKQQELSELTVELENYKQAWWDICYATMDDKKTSHEELQYLIDNTYSDIDNNQLISDLNKALQGKPVTRQTMPQQPILDNSKKTDKSKSLPVPQTETPAKDGLDKDTMGTTGDNPQPELAEPEKLDPTKKVNDPNKTVKEEKKEDKTTLRPDELVKQKKKHNNN